MIDPARLAEATRIAHAVSEVTNVVAYSRQPYVGASAFAHKAGLHASAIKIDPDLYQHTDPTGVGNDMRMLVSDMAGRASIEPEGPRARLRPGRAGRGAHRADRPGEAHGGPRLHLRRRRRLVRACCCARSSTASGCACSTSRAWRVQTDARGDEKALSEATVGSWPAAAAWSPPARGTAR
ncbi:hypothetical protein GCM10025868_40040 [Angustibacter aerolatus]|uniref:2-isopropylmalate synthase/homocitrate synthase post-catalytic domain-containing protein n=1 Tax=Angustibacter aerolatus TaxID=1162965 RepID=A0ABQ6JLJ6_9ACTN|nr:hypothetical protein [Angustibacter aerolatus]GMA88754.1 hypothetical protein GCM10025868_40040 [Angustibacter aerolatus]